MDLWSVTNQCNSKDSFAPFVNKQRFLHLHTTVILGHIYFLLCIVEFLAASPASTYYTRCL